MNSRKKKEIHKENIYVKMKKTKPKRQVTYCGVGALCLPPSNFAGITAYVEFPALWPPRGPRFKLIEPAVPDSVEVLKPGSRAQHSSVERLLRAPRTVTLRVLAAARLEEMKTGRRVERRILDRQIRRKPLCMYIKGEIAILLDIAGLKSATREK